MLPSRLGGPRFRQDRCCWTINPHCYSAPGSNLSRTTPALKRRLLGSGLQSLADRGEDLTIDFKTEQERQYRRTVFTLERWAAHRSTSRYWRHLSGIFFSRTVSALAKPVTILTLLAVAACLFETYMPFSGIPFEITEAPLSITSFALSLLLVFRTDASYARWQEAVQAWSQVRSISLEVARYGLQCINDKQLQLVLTRWTMALSISLKVHLRDDADIGDELEGILLPHEVAAVRSADSHIHFILQALSSIVESAHLSNLREERLFQGIMAFNDEIGKCDKLLRQPIPLAYTRHTSRFLMIGLGVLPFALWNDCGWAVIPIQVFISVMLLGIEEIGVQIEEPFGVMPLDEICAEIRKEVGAMLNSQDCINDTLRVSLKGVTSGGSSSLTSSNGSSGLVIHSNGANSGAAVHPLRSCSPVDDWHM